MCSVPHALSPLIRTPTTPTRIPASSLRPYGSIIGGLEHAEEPSCTPSVGGLVVPLCGIEALHNSHVPHPTAYAHDQVTDASTPCGTWGCPLQWQSVGPTGLHKRTFTAQDKDNRPTPSCMLHSPPGCRVKEELGMGRWCQADRLVTHLSTLVTTPVCSTVLKLPDKAQTLLAGQGHLSRRCQGSLGFRTSAGALAHCSHFAPPLRW